MPVEGRRGLVLGVHHPRKGGNLRTGGTVERFSAGNVYGPVEQVLYPTQHLMVEYLGMRSYPPFVAYASPRIDEAGRKAYLSQWRERLLEITKDAVPAQ